ncbi:c-type cytochrome domain-containing protein [Novipirellula maiorica]|uniref:c-type cytochrome domain-containing protein n=1 Tax=Novipirellula maiorica TaxID=1265734 RepID=UPI001F4060FB|nr:c-type cytochrome domain-containing protein [Rhodopirellula maiorica]
MIAADAVNFASHVSPILNKYCVGCHNADDSEGGLRLDDHAALMAGGETGLAVTAGAAGSSRMLLMITGKLDPAMPPDDEPGPNVDDIERIAAWIDQGAVGPDGDMPIKTTLRTPRIEPDQNTARPITSIAVAADGGLHAIARFASVQITRTDGTTVSQIDGLPGKVNSLQFSRDAKHILVASGVTGAYGRAALYRVDDGSLESELLGHRDVLYSAVFSPDGKWVATAGYDRVIKLWNRDTAAVTHELSGHNGAIYDLAFSHDSKVLVSASADATIKVWNVERGTRLDTLSQGEGEMLAVDFTVDGKYIVACGADNRLRVWRLASIDAAKINPLVVTRFVDESPLVGFAFTAGGKDVAVLSQSGNVKLLDTRSWKQVASLDPLPDTGTDIAYHAATHSMLIPMMNGEIVSRALPRRNKKNQSASETLQPIYMDLDALAVRNESDGKTLPRGAEVSGVISAAGEVDVYSWHANAGEVWAIDVDKLGNSPIDPIVSILDVDDQPVLRTRLHAVRESYFTFRGKDSKQSNDFRVFNWQDMNLGDYFYSSGEVSRLWKHPRGPDSGFDTYPGEGQRWTYFGTSGTTHALGEPGYVVRPLDAHQTPIANGLPVFDVYYENDDDPMRIAGNASRLLFTAPQDGTFKVRVTDTRGEGGEAFQYRLAVRAATPSFRPSITQLKGPIFKGTGREFIVRVDRIDGFDGPVTFTLTGLPKSIVSNSPIVLEAGQRSAAGTLWVPETISDDDAADWSGEVNIDVVATADILGRHVERSAGQLKKISLADGPNVIPSLHPLDHDVADDKTWVLQVRRGDTVSARVRLKRKSGFENEISFGKEDAGRNATQGVYVDNIGLNGLLILAGSNEREFFLTADPTSVPGRRSFFLNANTNGGVTSHPIIVEVLP